MPTTLSLANAERQAVILRDVQTATRLADAYRSSLKTIRDQALSLQSEIRRVGMTPAALARNPRYQMLLANTRMQIARFEQQATAIITTAQHQEIRAAQSAIDGMLRNGPNRLALPPSTLSLPRPGFSAGGKSISSLMAGMPRQTADMLRAELQRAAATNASPAVVAANVNNILSLPLTRAQTVSRTESMRVHRDTTQASMQANKHMLSGWWWMSNLSRTTCAVCWAMHGTKHRVGESMGSHPNCRCIMVPLPIGESLPADGSTRFSNLSADDQRAIVGQAKHDAMRNGDIRLTDLVGVERSRTWGTGRHENSLDDAVERAQRRTGV